MTHIPSPIFHDSHPTAHIPRSIIRFQLFCHRKKQEQRCQHAYPCPFLMIPELPAISLLFSSVAPNYVRYSISGPQFHLQSAIPFPVRSSISYPLLHLRSAVPSPIRCSVSGQQSYLQSAIPSPVRYSISIPHLLHMPRPAHHVLSRSTIRENNIIRSGFSLPSRLSRRILAASRLISTRRLLREVSLG